MSTSLTEHSLVAFDVADAAVGDGVDVVGARERGGEIVAFRRFSEETIASTSSSSLST